MSADGLCDLLSLMMGCALQSVLFGDVNPAGRLPVSFPRDEDDTWLQHRKQYPGILKQSDYSEKLLVGYRWYDAQDINPLFPFGHGLSYTQFTYSNLVLDCSASNLIVTVDLVNDGPVTGAEVVQLYVSFPESAGEPPKQLKGFYKLLLRPNQRKGAAFTLTKRDLSIWSVEKHGWEVVKGQFEVQVGASSRDVRLTAPFTIDEDNEWSAR